VVFGAIHPVDRSMQESDLIKRFITEFSARARCPVLSGIEAGHGSANYVLPFGAIARLDSERQQLSLIEAAVEI
jgi:muramoyltetrapeptide carboxypeptidase LdcA involved in peptidoglycan recycling